MSEDLNGWNESAGLTLDFKGEGLLRLPVDTAPRRFYGARPAP